MTAFLFTKKKMIQMSIPIVFWGAESENHTKIIHFQKFRL